MKYFSNKLSVLCLSLCLLGCEQVTTEPTIKLYILDNGRINDMDPGIFNFKAEELAETDFIVTSNLIVHPDGILLWETGSILDDDFPTDGSLATMGVFTATKTLRGQLAEIGYNAADIDYLAISHLHSDHNANANEYAGAHWIVQKADRDEMFNNENTNAELLTPKYFSALVHSETTILNNEDYDVFGDGSVMIISSPGHTQGHQVLLVNLPNSGSILLTGDLYHYPEEITTGRVPAIEYDAAMTLASREKVAQIIQENNAIMWMGHDIKTHNSLNFAPAHYD